MLLDQRVTDARYNRVSVYTHLIAAMGMGEHVGMVSKAYLLPLGDIIIRLELFTTCIGNVYKPCVSSRKWLSLSNLFGGTNAPMRGGNVENRKRRRSVQEYRAYMRVYLSRQRTRWRGATRAGRRAMACGRKLAVRVRPLLQSIH